MKPILKINKNFPLYWSPSPPNAGWAPSEITNEMLLQKYGVRRCEEILVEPATLPLFNVNMPIELPPEIQNQIEENSKKLVICDMGHGVGAGVFTREDIPKGTYLCIYSGVIEEKSTIKGKNDYCSWVELSGKSATINKQYTINAEKFGNISRFLQDLPDEITSEEPKQEMEHENELAFTTASFMTDKAFCLNPRLKENIAFANIHRIRHTFKCNDFYVSINLFVATRDIRTNEMLGYRYSDFSTYWSRTHKMRRFFYKDDYRIVPSNLSECLHTMIFNESDNKGAIITRNSLINYFQNNSNDLPIKYPDFTWYSAYISWLFFNKANDRKYKRLNCFKLIDEITSSDPAHIKSLLETLILSVNFERASKEELQLGKEHIYFLPDDLARVFGAACVRMSNLSKHTKTFYAFEAKKYFLMLGDTTNATVCGLCLNNSSLPTSLMQFFIPPNFLTLHYASPEDGNMYHFLKKNSSPSEQIYFRGEWIKK